MSNKRLNSDKPAPAKRPPARVSAKMVADPKEKVRQLREQVQFLEVQIAAAPRLIAEEKRRYVNTLPPPDSMRKPKSIAPTRLTHSKQLAKRREQMFLLLEFAVGFILVVGAAAWAYKAWVAFTGR